MAASEPLKDITSATYAGQCDKHGDFVGSRTSFGTRTWESGCPQCSKERQDAQEAKERAEFEERQRLAKQARLAERRRKSGIPPRFDDRTFDAFATDTPGRAKAKATMQALVAEIREGNRARNVIMSGKPGTGKSHLACAVVHELYEAKTVRRLVLADLIRTIRDTWRRDSEMTETEVLKFYGSEVDLLLIEEVGTTSGSEDEKARVFAVLNARYENCLPTVIVTNLGMEALVAELGERVIDRLREDGGILLPFDWESMRGKA